MIPPPSRITPSCASINVPLAAARIEPAGLGKHDENQVSTNALAATFFVTRLSPQPIHRQRNNDVGNRPNVLDCEFVFHVKVGW